MSPARVSQPVRATAAGAKAGSKASDAKKAAVAELVAKIRDKDDEVRYGAMQSAGEVGPPAIRPLAAAMNDKDYEIARAAKRALWNVVRYVGRPGGERQKERAVKQLLVLLGDNRPIAVQREVIWMLSELAGDEAVEPVAALLKDKDLREDARMVLQRLPGEKSLAALKQGLEQAPEEFRPNIALSLRERGVKVEGIRIVSREPSRKTDLKPLEPGEIEQKPRRRERVR